MTDHFKQGGLSCPDNYNPADFVMFVAQTESIESLEEKKLFMDVNRTGMKISSSDDLKVEYTITFLRENVNSHFLIYDNNTIHTYRP